VATPTFETADTRAAFDHGALVLTLQRERPSITSDVLDALERGVAEAERAGAPFVVASQREHFAFGATLDDAFDAAADGAPEVLDRALDRYQSVMLALRHARVPTVAAVRGVAISGGCEVLMHCTRVVAHRAVSIGLMEGAVGVVPGGGGLKELAFRAAASGERDAHVAAAVETVGTATVGRGGANARRLGFLTEADVIDAPDPVADAITLGLSLIATHVPPSRNPRCRVAGPAFRNRLVDMQRARHVAGELTTHQLDINGRIADVLCGGDAPGEERSEQELLALERRHFLVLAANPLTQKRLEHLRATGTLLRN
jgi:3-hydroxyacyl-CoA dehydrogenase